MEEAIKWVKNNLTVTNVVIAVVALVALRWVYMYYMAESFEGDNLGVKHVASISDDKSENAESGSSEEEGEAKENSGSKYNSPDAACMKGDCVQGLCSDGRQCETLEGDAGNFGMASAY